MVFQPEGWQLESPPGSYSRHFTQVGSYECDCGWVIVSVKALYEIIIINKC